MLNFYYCPILGLQYSFIELSVSIPEDFDVEKFKEEWSELQNQKQEINFKRWGLLKAM